MTADIKTLSDEDLVYFLIKIHAEEIYEFCYGNISYAAQLAVAVAAARAELLARLSEKEEEEEE